MKGDQTVEGISIISALNAIHCSAINNINVDLLNKEVTFDLSLTDKGKVTNHELKFINCISFLWLEKDKYAHEAYDFSKCDYYELTAVNLKSISATSDDKWLKQYPMEYNVVIEIWETALLIHANELSIDHQHFSIL